MAPPFLSLWDQCHGQKSDKKFTFYGGGGSYLANPQVTVSDNMRHGTPEPDHDNPGWRPQG